MTKPIIMEQKLHQFLESRYQNTWLKPEKGKQTEVYVRKGIRRIPNCPPLQSLDVANFGMQLVMAEVLEFLKMAEQIKEKYDIIYLENVDSHVLIGHLILHGYTVHKKYSTPHYACLYKILPDPNLPS